MKTRKILALLLALAMLVSVTPVFAEETTGDTTTEEVTYDSLAEQYDAEVGNFTRIKTSWKVSGGAVSEMEGNSMSTYTSGKGNFAILKVDLPALGNGQKYGKMIVRFTHGAGTNNNIAFKVEDIDVPNVSSIADTAFYTTIIANRTAPAYIAYESANPVVTESPASGVYFHYVDITKWAQESYYAGKDYVYLAVGAWNSTTNMYATTATDSSYVGAKYYPGYWYSFEDVEAPAPLENTAEAMQALGNETLIPAANGFYSAAGTVSAAPKKQSVHMGNGNFGIVKIDLPTIPAGYTLGNFAFRYGNISNSTEFQVFKMVDVQGELPADITGTDYYAYLKARNSAYYANDAAVVTTDGLKSASYKLGYFNITSYIKECYAKGYDHCYLAYGCGSTVNAASPTTTDSTYVGNGLKPVFYYSLDEIGALELVSSTPANGETTGETTATFTFSNVLKSATATVNGESADCTVNGTQVTIELGSTGEKTIVITATDTARNTITTDAVTVKAGYGKANLTANTYIVNSTGSTVSKYNPSASYVVSVIFRIPLPEVADGKEIENFTFNFISPNAIGSQFQLVKLPGEDWEVANLVQTDGEVAEGLTNIYSFTQDPVSYNYVNKATRAKITSERVDIAPSASNDDGKSYMNHANLSQYARECIARGQSTMWLAVRSNSTVAITGVGDSSHAGAGRIHTVTWTIKEKDAAIAAPKAVFAAEEVSYDEASATTLLEKETEYKFITKANVEGKLVVAQYDANKKLVSIDAADLDGTGADVAAAFTTGAEDGFVKVFVWAADKMAPTDDDITVLAVK